MFKDIPSRISIYKRLESLYHAPEKEARFRHYYSDIFSVLTQIRQDPSLGNIDILGQNLNIILTGYKPQNKDSSGNMIDISENIKKLYDHVSLDIARIVYSDAGDWRISGESAISELRSQIDIVNSNTEKARLELEAQRKELSSQQKEYVAILGIFAAVVLAFTGGIAFSTSVLDNIGSVSIYRITLLALIIGLILIDILFLSFRYIDKIVNGNNSYNYKAIIALNALFIILISITILGWHQGWVEARNQRICSSYNKLEQFELEDVIYPS